MTLNSFELNVFPGEGGAGLRRAGGHHRRVPQGLQGPFQPRTLERERVLY